MADTFTANYNFTKPEVNSSRDTWGGKNNANLDVIDGMLKAIDVGKLNNKNTKLVEGDTIFRIAPVVQPVDPGPASSLITLDMLNLLFDTMFPVGSIILWGGTIANIPGNWRLCDGTNGTPPLSGRFARGADAVTPGNEVGAIAGAATHQHTIGAHALIPEEMPYHTHTVYDQGHYHAVTDPGHSHTYYRVTETDMASGLSTGTSNSLNVTTNTGGTGKTGITLGVGYANLAVGYAGASWGHVHTIDALSNLPPYVTLAYIMRVV